MSETVQFFIKETIAKQENIQHLGTLDLELMACSLLGVERSKLLTSPIALNQDSKDEFWSMIRRRMDGEPLAYILGKKGFWNLDLEVNNQVLVPRPETEILIEDILLNFNQTNLSVLDLGTGSGAIGLSLKKEKKEWDVYCSDISINALEVANKNSLKNNLRVNFVCCDWLNAFKTNSFDLLISNPPYIKSDDIRLKSDGLSHEPLEALVSGATGKEHLFVIATSSKRFLKKGGYLYLENSPSQANELKLFLKELNFNQTNLSLLDLGTGSGAIGLSLKKEKKEWDVYCSDISINALEVAYKNSLKNNLEVNFICCDWLNTFKPDSFDLLISNPPYIKTNDIRLKSDGLSYEPLEALVSGTTGKEHLFVIATSSKRFLKKGGFLYLEHSPCQAKDLKLFLKKLNFKNISEIFDLNGDKRVIKAQLF